MEIRYKPTGTCCREIVFRLEEGKIYGLRFIGGCDGNAKGIAALTEGADAAQIAERCAGIRCGYKNTSCPDQLARAIGSAIDEP